MSRPIGYKHSKETIEKIRQSNLGKERSLQTRIRNSIANKGRISPMMGKKHSLESLQKMSKSHKENPSRYWLGKKRPTWRKVGNKHLIPQGYVLVCMENGYDFEHRIIMANHLKRKLTRYDVVHHINGVKNDNRIENLQVMTLAEHSALHQNIKPKKYCTINGCNKYHEAKGLCNKHYLQEKRYGYARNEMN